MESKKDRTEYVGIWTTPEMAKEIKLAESNSSLQDTIIKQYIHSETAFLEQELKEIDEYTIKYRAKLIGIKDSFSKAQDSYIAEIEAIYTKAETCFKRLDTLAKDVNTKINESKFKLEDLNKSLGYIDASKLERLLNTVTRYNDMSCDEKELISLILKK
jgi:hypothetical protein